MPLITAREKIGEYKKIVEYLNELQIPAKFASENEILEKACMVFFLPDFKNNNFSENGFLGNINTSKFATGVITQMDAESENQLTKYLFITVTENVSADDFEEETLLRVLNRLNQAVRVGFFFYEEEKSGFSNNKQIKYQYRIPASTMKGFDIAVICESIVEMGLGFDLLLKSLTVL